jgi:hypothetical protein
MMRPNVFMARIAAFLAQRAPEALANVPTPNRTQRRRRRRRPAKRNMGMKAKQLARRRKADRVAKFSRKRNRRAH